MTMDAIGKSAVTLGLLFVAVLAGVALGRREPPPRAVSGKILYERHCASCYGPEGRGDGPAAEALEPRPSDLTRLERVRDEATTAGAAAVILEINTFGGRVDAAVLIRDALLRARVRTVAFVSKRAISAGALISLAAEAIAIADGGTIGAATPAEIGLPGTPAQPVAEKTVSYMRKEFRATAESRKRPPLLAEAMVDADVRPAGIADLEGERADA